MSRVFDLYNSFENKDMSFKDFRERYSALTDPKKMKQDMGKIMAEKKQRGMMADINRTSIDRALEE